MTFSHDNSVVGCVTIDNHENTDKVIEATEEIVPMGYHKMDMAARVCMKQSFNTNQNDNNQSSLRFGFYDVQGNQVLTPELKLLQNPMYPDFDFGFYSRKTQDKTKIRLYHINEDGYQDLGVFSDATPLNENLVAVRKTNESKFFGIIDKTGKVVLEDDKVGEIYGINKDGCLVCEVRPGAKGLANLKGEKLRKNREFNHYFVGPNSDLIYAFDECRDFFQPFYSSTESDSFSIANLYFNGWRKVDIILFFNQKVFAKGVDIYERNECSEWCNQSDSYVSAYYDFYGNDLQIWFQKPLFPLFKVNSKLLAPMSKGCSTNYREFKPDIVAESWTLEHSDSRWNLYEYKEDVFNRITGFYYSGEMIAVYGHSRKQQFIHFEGDTIFLLWLTNTTMN